MVCGLAAAAAVLITTAAALITTAAALITTALIVTLAALITHAGGKTDAASVGAARRRDGF